MMTISIRKTRVHFAALIILGALQIAPAWAREVVHERPCADERDLRSVRGMTSTNLYIRNTAHEERDLYWLNYDGFRVFYSRLAPGQQTTQQTYATHPWVVTTSTGQCVTIFIATRRDGALDLY